MKTTVLARLAVCLVLGLALFALQPGFAQQKTANKPVKVTIDTEEAEVVALPLDPVVRIEHQYVGNMSFGVTAEGKMLTCGPGAAHTLFKINNQVFFPDIVPQQQALPPGPNGKKRNGIQATWKRGDVHFTQVIEIIPGRPLDKNAAQKRRMDCLLIKYIIENTGAADVTVGVRQHIDTLVVNNDGAIFAAPEAHPNKLLDGVAFKGKDVPEIVEILERADLKNPGFKGVFTFKVGKLQGPDRIVLTGLRAGGEWDIAAVPAMGDSACAFFWENITVKAKSKHEVGFGYGQSRALNPENEGKVYVNFAGNFEPNKAFTVTAYVEDPLEGQALTLLLPKGLERLEGKDTQTVPQPLGDGQAVVLWRCRVQEMGTFPIRIRSSNGVTETRVLTVAPGE
jgi:hypothetical protein